MVRGIRITKFKCQKCGHIWIPRKEEKPTICPKCKSWKYIVEVKE